MKELINIADELLKTQKELIKTTIKLFKMIKLYIEEYFINNESIECDKSFFLKLCESLDEQIKNYIKITEMDF